MNRKMLISLLSLIPLAALAEAPMAVDDAGTVAKGGMKIEGTWSKDDQQRGPGLLFGFSPLQNLELGMATTAARDGGVSPSTRLRGVGVGGKWVPIQNETGWSLGLRAEFWRTRIDEPSVPQKFTEREAVLTGLATYRFQGGQVVHLNLGGVRTKAQGERDARGTWGLGYEYPLLDQLKLTAEVYGEQHGRPDKAVGLRYEIVEGLKISGAIGRGNDRSFGQAAISWEF